MSISRKDSGAEEPKLSMEEKWRNAFKRDLKWNKDDLLDVIFWFRQIFGLVAGIICGCVPVIGFMGHLGFIAVNAMFFYLYYTKFLGVDDEEFGKWDLFFEGAPTSYGFFLVAWIVCFSLVFN